MLQALIAGVVLIILALVAGQSTLWVAGLAVIAGGLIRQYFIDGRNPKTLIADMVRKIPRKRV